MPYYELDTVETWGLIALHGGVLSQMKTGFSPEAARWHIERLAELTKLLPLSNNKMSP